MSLGKLTEQEIRDNVKPLFYTRMRLGEFDPEEMNPYNKIDNSVIQSPEHRDLAIRAAMESFVLLKNRDDLLPLKGPVDRLAVCFIMILTAFTLLKLEIHLRWPKLMECQTRS